MIASHALRGGGTVYKPFFGSPRVLRLPLRRLAGPLYGLYERRLTRTLRRDPVPHHLAVIMDGNRRFAARLGLAAHLGHSHGKNKLEELLDWCQDLDIKVLTVYAFSTENLKRNPEELSALMDLFATSFRQVADDARIHQRRIRVRALGRVELLPDEVQEAIAYAQERTAGYSDYYFNLAVAYGGREEIVQAMQAIAKRAVAGELMPEAIDVGTITSHLYTSDLPDPDLIMRTSGEERISNFLLWQVAYSELYFTDVFWPELRKVDFLRAIRSYQHRSRRLGQ